MSKITLSITVSRETADKLHMLAGSMGVTANKLCANMLEELPSIARSFINQFPAQFVRAQSATRTSVVRHICNTLDILPDNLVACFEELTLYEYYHILAAAQNLRLNVGEET